MRLRKLALSCNVVCTGTSSIRMAWTLSLKYLSVKLEERVTSLRTSALEASKTRVVNEKRLVFRGSKSAGEII